MRFFFSFSFLHISKTNNLSYVNVLQSSYYNSKPFSENCVRKSCKFINRQPRRRSLTVGYLLKKSAWLWRAKDKSPDSALNPCNEKQKGFKQEQFKGCHLGRLLLSQGLGSLQRRSWPYLNGNCSSPISQRPSGTNL